MRKAKNLSKVALEVITDINRLLRLNNVTDEGNMLFNFGCNYLLKKDMYHGFNTFIWKETPDGSDMWLTECGADAANNGKFDCLQIYIGGGFTIGERTMSKINNY